jgi:hypothetical protein
MRVVGFIVELILIFVRQLLLSLLYCTRQILMCEGVQPQRTIFSRDRELVFRCIFESVPRPPGKLQNCFG